MGSSRWIDDDQIRIFRVMSPLSRGTLKSKGDRKLSILFCADDDTIETFFRTDTQVCN